MKDPKLEIIRFEEDDLIATSGRDETVEDEFDDYDGSRVAYGPSQFLNNKL